MRIRIQVAGRGYDSTKLPEQMEFAANETVASALAKLREHLGDGNLSPTTLVILAGRHLGSIANYEDAPLADGDELMLLQPVAGG
jgi:molybdopterin converting factor small subunit